MTATFKAQQTGCGSTWQMNAGRGAGDCDHQLVLTLDDDVSLNTWRTDPALDSCELRTLAGRPVVIEARQWHDPNAEGLLGELVLAIVSPRLVTPPTVCTCGEIRQAYKSQKCCNNASQLFNLPTGGCTESIPAAHTCLEIKTAFHSQQCCNNTMTAPVNRPFDPSHIVRRMGL